MFDKEQPNVGPVYASAIVTLTSTPGSMLMLVICLTISDGLCRSIRRLWMRIWNLSQVLEPSPQGVLRVVIRRVCAKTKKGEFSAQELPATFIIAYSAT